jgi:CRP-like cAMP-binding protein
MELSHHKEILLRFLQSNPAINQQKAKEISEHFYEKSFEKNEFFLRAGQWSNEYLILTSGIMRAFAIDTEGSEVTTALYSGDQPVFEVASFFNRTQSQENIQAINSCTGWCIQYDELNKLFHTLPEFREFGRSILVKGFAALKLRMLSMVTEPAEKRYASLLETSPQIIQQVPLKYIASYLGITDTSLSRIRKEIIHK